MAQFWLCFRYTFCLYSEVIICPHLFRFFRSVDVVDPTRKHFDTETCREKAHLQLKA